MAPEYFFSLNLHIFKADALDNKFILAKEVLEKCMRSGLINILFKLIVTSMP